MLYSVGYEGRTVDQFIQALVAAGVDVLYDVRLNPVSRKPGFSKNKLRDALEAAGVDYVHEPLLGNPPDNRDAFRNGNVEQGRARFQQRLNNGSRDALDKLTKDTRQRIIALLCVEKDADRCHRKVITEAVQDTRPELMVAALS